MRSRRSAYFAVLMFVVSLLFCPVLAKAAPPAQKLNVIVVAMDQLQADQLHCYGNWRETSPNIDRVAASGVRFSKFYTVASWTTPSYASLMSSLFPSRHGATLLWNWHPGMQPVIDPKVPMMAQTFKAHGYRTAAFVSNALGGKGLTDRGFEQYFQYQEAGAPINITQRKTLGAQLAPYRAPYIMKHLDPWLNAHRKQPFFVFVLFWEPHSPYNPPPDDDIFKSDAYPNEANTGYNLKRGHLLRLADLGDQKAVERLYQLYDGKIHYIDRYIGQLMNHLKVLGLEDKTLVVLTSDHGELMFSHRRDYMTADHRSLYNSDLHIPLIMHGPGLPKGKVFDAIASNVDTAPTVLNLAGLPPLSDAEGKSLVPVIAGKARSAHPYIYAEEDIAVPLRSIRGPRYRLIYNLWDGERQLFDLQTDPGELQNVAQQNPQVTEKLFSHLQKWMKANLPSKEIQLSRWKKFTAREKVITVDDQTIGGRMLLSGTGQGWHSDENPQDGNYAGGCFWAFPGPGSQTATWRNDDPMVGTYQILEFHGKLPQGSPLATNAPFTVATVQGNHIVRVDFTKNAGKWNLLGTYTNPRTVTVSNDANGRIIVDAVRFQRVPQ